MKNVTISEVWYNGRDKQVRKQLQDIYTRPGVKEGITSDTNFHLTPNWYLDPAFYHAVMTDEDTQATIGTIFYEIIGLNRRVSLHVNYFKEYQRPEWTTAGGKAFLRHIRINRPLVTMLSGLIPDVNRKARIFALRFGWREVASAVTEDGIKYSMFEFNMGDYNE